MNGLVDLGVDRVEEIGVQSDLHHAEQDQNIPRNVQLLLPRRLRKAIHARSLRSKTGKSRELRRHRDGLYLVPRLRLGTQHVGEALPRSVYGKLGLLAFHVYLASNGKQSLQQLHIPFPEPWNETIKCIYPLWR